MSALRKSIGTFPLIAMGAAGIIGTSWIYTNGEFFAAYGAGGEIFGLAIATVLVSFVAMAYAELASKLPRAGGEIVYGYVAFNRTVSFVGGWLLIGAYVSSLAFYVTASGTLLSQLFPSLESIPLYTIAGSEVYLPMLLVGMAMAVLVCIVNCYGTGFGAGTQLAFFCLMLAIGAVLVVVGFATGSPSNFWPPYEPGSDAVLSTLRFVLPALTFLTGFGLVAILAEDADVRPANIARIVVAVVVIAGSFYCVVLLASAWIIPWTKTATLDQGTIDTYRVAGFPALGWGAYTISVLGLVTSFLALFVAASRIMVGLARAGLFPSAFARVSERRGTPVNALLFTLALCLGLGWLGEGALTWFLDTGGVYVGLAWFIGIASMYWIRRRYPRLESPYRVRVSFLPAIGGVVAVLVILLTLVPGTDIALVWPSEYIILLAWIVLGAIIYAIAPKERDEQALRALLGDQYAKIGAEPGEAETATTDRAP
jgi:APA family basic amino acid/polyamine antiporter